MPRFDEGEQNLKLIYGNIVLMGNPDQYGEILAENIFVEDITRSALQTLISNSELVRGKYYRITNAVGSTLSLIVQALTATIITDTAYNTANGELYTYDITSDTASQGLDINTLDLTPQTAPSFLTGRVWYDSDTNTLSYYDDISGTSIQVGQEEVLRARNSTGSTILNGAVVYVSGAQGQNPRISLAQANAESTSRVIGVATHNISNNSVGKVCTFGIVNEINTSAYNEGDVLYLSTSVAGGLTTTRPSAPNQAVMVGTVIHSSVSTGKILVHPDNYGIGYGTANQVRGMNAAGTAEEYKTFTSSDSTLSITHSSGVIDLKVSSISGLAAGGELAGTYPNPTLVNNSVTAKVLTGLSVSGSAIVSTDSILTALGKAQNQINALAGGVNYRGTWNASTNSPALASGVGTQGYYYVVTVAGSTNLDGITDWKLGDWAIFNGTAWQKVDNTDAVVSVNGYMGIVTLSASDVGALPTSAISGTTGKLAKFGSSSSVVDSVISESSSKIGINTTTYGETFNINGSLGFQYLGSQNWHIFTTATNSIFFTRSGIADALEITSDLQFITNGAPDTGEHFIVGGSLRVNGNIGQNTTLSNWTSLNNVNALQNKGGALYNYELDSIILGQNIYISTALGNTYVATGAATTYVQSAGVHVWQTAASGTANTAATLTTRMSLSSTELITFGATDTGEAHIFGGSARVNGQVTTTSLSGYRLLDGADTLFSLGYSGGTLLNRLTGTSFLIAENGSPQVTIASGGAATFSSSVTAGASITIGTSGSYVAGSIYSDANWGMLFRAKQASPTNAYHSWVTSADVQLMQIRSNGVLNISNVPTSASGLISGDIWNDGGTLKIV